MGKDARAQAFLGTLDTDRTVGDIIDCTSYFENEAEEYQVRGVPYISQQSEVMIVLF